MITTPSSRLLTLVPLALLAACETESRRLVVEPEMSPAAYPLAVGGNAWSAPVNVGAPVNSEFIEQTPMLSEDGLSLYFSSNRPGGVGGFDIWVAQRASEDSPWGTPVNLGPVINSSGNESVPQLSRDERLLFFASTRPGGLGGSDMWVARRDDKHDDFDWEAPVNMGPDINTTGFDAGPSHVRNADGGVDHIYFSRGPTAADQDLYFAAVTKDGEALGPAVLIAELSSPTLDARPTLPKDGEEIIFGSKRGDPSALVDLWVSTRRSVRDPWSTPEFLTALNTAFEEVQPSLSFDGRTLVFSSNRPGTLGLLDIYVSTREPGGP